MKRRDLLKKLKAADFYMVRDDDDHTIYKKDGWRSVQIPRHRELNELTAQSILKVTGLK